MAGRVVAEAVGDHEAEVADELRDVVVARRTQPRANRAEIHRLLLLPEPK